jgi:hypothetical protein
LGVFTVLTNDDKAPASDEDAADFTPPAEPVEQAQAQEPEVPEKYRGKSLTDIIEMHRNAESELGRARNEVGTVRKLADELLGVHRASPPASPAKPVERRKLTADDLLTDPSGTVLEVVRAEVSEREKALADRTANLESQFALQKFERKHPDYQQTMTDPKFSDWVQKSPLRVSLAQASMNGNYMAADELFTLYSEVALSAPAPEPKAPDPVQQARKASLTRPGSASAAGGGKPNEPGTKVWKRSELLTMRMNNPEEFDRLQPEIIKAYREKRVR